MLTVADRGEDGVTFAKILLTSYVNAPLISAILKPSVSLIHRNPVLNFNIQESYYEIKNVNYQYKSA